MSTSVELSCCAINYQFGEIYFRPQLNFRQKANSSDNWNVQKSDLKALNLHFQQQNSSCLVKYPAEEFCAGKRKASRMKIDKYLQKETEKSFFQFEDLNYDQFHSQMKSGGKVFCNFRENYLTRKLLCKLIKLNYLSEALLMVEEMIERKKWLNN